MTDWMDEREKAYRAQVDAERHEGELQLHRRKMLELKARPFLDALTAQVGRDVDSYHQKVSDQNRRVEFHANPSGGFSLRQSHFPAVSVHCTLDQNLGAIIADYAMTLNHESGTRTAIQHFQLGLDSNDNMIIGLGEKRFASLADASRAIIERVLYPS